MSTFQSLIKVGALFACLLVPFPLRATGIYIDFTAYFSAIDTAGTSLRFEQTELQRDDGRAAILSVELALRTRERVLVRLRLPYQTIQRETDFLYDIGDGTIRSEVRVFGDTLNVSGLYLLGDVRLPSGAKDFRPISYGSLDGGGGFELRGETSFFRLRVASTFTLVGDRIKTGPFIHDNYTTVAFSLETALGGHSSLSFGGFGLLFRGGEKREAYVVSIRQDLWRGIEAVVSGALEAGSDEERVFNSQVAIAISYAFLSPSVDGK